VTLLGNTRQHPDMALHTVSLDGGSPTITTLPVELYGRPGNRFGEFAWAAAGTALYVESSLNFVWNLWRLDVDSTTLKAGALTRLTGGAGQDTRPAVSRDGRRLAFTTSSESIRLWAYSLDPSTGRVTGAPQPVTDPTTAVPASAALSPDGRQLAYSITGVGTGRWDLWRSDLVTGQKHLLSRDNNSRFDPHWSSDSSRLVYQWGRGGAYVFEHAVAIRPASGGDEALLSQATLDLGCEPLDWSPDGKSILVAMWRRGQLVAELTLWPVAAAPRAETAAAVVAADPNHDLWQGRFSPDGRWISFVAAGRGSGAHVVCVVPSSARKTVAADWTCLTDPAVWTDKPRWSSDGKLLYVWRLNGSLFNVWALRFDAARGSAVGQPMQVTQFDSPAHRIWADEIGLAEPSVAGHRMTLPIADATGSIWMLDNLDR